MQNFVLFNIRRFLTPAGHLLGISFLLLFIGPSLKSVVTVIMAINVALTVWFLSKVLSITSFRFQQDWASIKSFVTYGIKSYLQILSGHLIYQIDLYLIAYFLGAKQVAFYSIAVGMATLLWYIPNTVGIVLFPTLSSVQNEKEIHRFSGVVCRNTLLITALGAICLGLVGKYVVLLFYGDLYDW